MFEELQALLNLPGMDVAIRLAPIVWAVIWVMLTVLLWRGGFTDLIEKLTRPRWAGPARVEAVMMMPIRALMLTGVAAVTGIITTLGIGFNAAIILGVMQAIRAGG
ncbi:hypothetical protein [uncultured Maricaulis sp.]|jgi:hypothetical protein|uniref:hypothetical protein n=1 Tax=uncultured Maricaulis sp. TaxID=174710 RepID=UPI0025EDE5D3|nr:hypothetical protein [uncultured Maricaulis sp.]